MSGLQYTTFCWADLHYLQVKTPLLHSAIPHCKLNLWGFPYRYIWILRQKLKLINNKLYSILNICNVSGDSITSTDTDIATSQISKFHCGDYFWGPSKRHFFNFRKFLKTIEMISEPVGILSLFTLVLIVINYF